MDIGISLLRRALCLVVGALTVLSLACPKKPKPLPVQSAFADFTLATLAGETLSLSSFRGRVLVIDFWSSSSAPCRLVLPELIRIHRTCDERKVAFLGVNLNDRPEDAEKCVRENAVPWPVMVGTNDIARAYSVQSLPTTLVMDRNGNVVWRETGLNPDSALAGLERTLNKLTGRKNAQR